MRKIRIYMIACILMLLTAFLSLVVLSSLTYCLKWQADKAMGGIIVAYILSGFAGGMGYKWIPMSGYREKRLAGIKEKALDALVLSGLFLLILMLVSIVGLQIPFEVSGRLFLIIVLVISSCFLGRIL